MDDIRQTARNFVKTLKHDYYPDRNPLSPMALWSIEKRFDVKIIEEEPKNDTISARIFTAHDSGVILINTGIPTERMSFYRARALGQYMFASRICGYRNFDYLETIEPHDPILPNEEFANEFALAVKMPEEGMLDAASKGYVSIGELANQYWINTEYVREWAEHLGILRSLRQ